VGSSISEISDATILSYGFTPAQCIRVRNNIDHIITIYESEALANEAKLKISEGKNEPVKSNAKLLRRSIDDVD
jgi:hypothetical protein